MLGEVAYPLQLLHQIPHILHTRPKPFTNILLRLLINIQKPFNHFPIHKPERLGRLSHWRFEGAVGVEVDVAEGLDDGRHAGLEAHEEVLGTGGNEGDEVDCSFGLKGKSVE
jgi:hypothetical protein